MTTSSALVASDDLNPQKSRVLLRLALLKQRSAGRRAAAVPGVLVGDSRYRLRS